MTQVVPTQTSTGAVLSNASLLANATVLPNSATVIPNVLSNNSAVLPNTTAVLPNTNTVIPNTAAVLPTNSVLNNAVQLQPAQVQTVAQIQPQQQIQQMQQVSFSEKTFCEYHLLRLSNSYRQILLRTGCCMSLEYHLLVCKCFTKMYN